MKAVFCSTMYTDVSEELRKSKQPRPISGHKFAENLIRGIYENGVDITVVNVPRVKHYPQYADIILKRKPFLLDGKTFGINVGILNLKWVNYISAAVNVFCETRRYAKKNKDENVVFFVYNTHLPQSLALLALRKLYRNIRLCDVIGDLHGSYGTAGQSNGLHGKLVSRLGNLSDKAARHFDMFVFVTDQMAKALGVENKKHVVMEGFYKADPIEYTKAEDDGSKTIFYAGYLGLDYDIEHLLRSFCLIEDEDYRLVLAGNAPDPAVIERYAENDSRIRFLGFITPEEVSEWQSKATVLISPRTNDHEYVKYSFPSKTWECLASGKPYIAHRLSCDPPEYADHIQYAEDESDTALRDKIVEICEMPEEERRKIGERARKFILTEKNPRVMCKRVVDMWSSVTDVPKEGSL